MARPKPCIVCGRKTDGSTRCEFHANQAGKRSRACITCGRPTMGNYCPDHDPVANEMVRRERQPWRKAYNDPMYRKNRQLRYDRAAGRCEECGLPVGPGEWECDHLIALSDGGTNDYDNLRVRCVKCHRDKTAEARRSR